MGGSSTKNYYRETRTYYDFSPYIASHDISRVISDLDPDYEDRMLLQEARTLVIYEDHWIFRNCEIRVVGQDIDCVLASGSPSNIYVITKKNGEVNRLCESKSLRLKLRDAGRKVWSWVKTGASKVIGAIQNGGRKVIQAITDSEILPDVIYSVLIVASDIAIFAIDCACPGVGQILRLARDVAIKCIGWRKPEILKAINFATPYIMDQITAASC